MFYGSCSAILFFFAPTLNLDPKNRGTWFAYQGIGVSVASQLYVLYRHMDNRRWFWVMNLCFQPFSIWRTFNQLPRTNKIEVGCNLGWESRHDRIEVAESSDEQKAAKTTTSSTLLQGLQGFAEIAKSPSLWFGILWIFFEQNSYDCFMTQFEPWLIWASNGDEETKNFFLDIQIYFILGGIIFGMTSGKLFNTFDQYLVKKKGYKANYATILVSCTWFTVSCFLIAIEFFCYSFQATGVNLWIAMVANSLARRIYIFNLFLVASVPKELFGRARAFVLIFETLFCLLPPLWIFIINEVFNGEFHVIELIYSGMGLLSLSGPLMIYLYWFKYVPESRYEKMCDDL